MDIDSPLFAEVRQLFELKLSQNVIEKKMRNRVSRDKVRAWIKLLRKG